MKKNDGILIGIVIICALVFYGGYNLYTGAGDEVVVYVDGVEYGAYDLNVDQTITIESEGVNILEIQDGEAHMIEADCPDSLCIHQGGIHNNTESIICLPNKVVVEVRSQEESEYDVVVQ